MKKPDDWNCDFTQLEAVLKGEKPDRPVLFELFTNDELIRDASGMTWPESDTVARDIAMLHANEALGYDYAILCASDFDFPRKEQGHKQTVSLNGGSLIVDRESFEAYPWPDPDAFSMERLDRLQAELPEGMRLLIWSPEGLLEAVIRLVGYENLCYMLYDEPELVADIFEAAGSRFYRYFERCIDHPAVAGVVSSDDWGFNTQTLLPRSTMQEYLYPWQKKLVSLAHGRNKYAILHSCGAFRDILEDIIELGFDAKHSYEDNIWAVESAYEAMKGRIAVLGGLDMDFMCRKTPEEVQNRAACMLEQTGLAGYALGTGNSVPEYVPRANYLAMLQAAYGRL